MKRALQEITNVHAKNIKLTIARKEPLPGRGKALLDRISPEYLEYKHSFYKTMDFPLCASEESGPVDNAYVRAYGAADGVTLEMRRTLVEWLYDVTEDFKLLGSTFEMAVRYTDSFVLNGGQVQRKEFQLLGCTSLFIAAKANETTQRKAALFTEICDNAYTRAELLRMERTILATVTRLFPLLPAHFLLQERTEYEKALLAFFSRTVLLNVEYAFSRPSQTAAFVQERVDAVVRGARIEKLSSLVSEDSTMFLSLSEQMQQAIRSSK